MKQYFVFGNHFRLPAYNLFIAIGIAIGMLLLQYNISFRKYHSTIQHKIHTGLLLAILTGFLGGYIFDSYTQHRPLFNSLQYGLTLLGGILTGFAVLIIYLKMNKITIHPVLNMLTPSFAIAHCFGRIACFFAGCCFGKPTKSIFGVVFPVNSLPYQHYHALIAIHPTQLYEACFAAVLFLILYFSRIKNTFYLYFGTYAIFRFCIEFIRADDRGSILGQTWLSPSQFISVIIFLFCCGMLINIYKKNTIVQAV